MSAADDRSVSVVRNAAAIAKQFCDMCGALNTTSGACRECGCARRAQGVCVCVACGDSVCVHVVHACVECFAFLLFSNRVLECIEGVKI